MGALTTQSRMASRDWVRLTLLVLLLLGGALRLYNVNWDDYQHAHPDERHVTWVATSITWPEDSATRLDPLRTTLNPYRWPPAARPPAGEPRAFTYGHFPLYVLAATSQFLSGIFAPVDGGRWADYDHIQLVGRVLSALWDTLTILLIFLLGRELFGRKIGLLGAAFQALAVLHIQLAHFATFDVKMATFVTLAVLMAVRGVQRGRLGDFLLAGVAGGLAIGSLARALPILLPIGIAPLVRLGQENGHWLKFGQWDAGQRRRAYLLLGIALLALFLSVLTFVLTNPFAILDFQSFFKDFNEQRRMVSGEIDFPFTRQYRGTPAYIYQIEQQVRWGLGWPLGIAGFLGVAWALARLLRRRGQAGEWIILAWFLPYFLINGSFMVKFMRYMVVLTPFLCLYASQLIGTLAGWLSRLGQWRLPRLNVRLDGRWLAGGLVAVCVGWTALYALAFASIYTRPHTWIQASRWIYQNIPANATIAVEHWDDEMPKPLRGDNKANPPARPYKHITLPLYEEDTPAKYQIIKDALQRADYVILATNRLYRSIPRMPQRYPMTIKYYDLLFSGKLGFELQATFTSRPQIGPLVWVDDDADESFTVYDHPKPLIFKKVRQLSDEEWAAALGNSWQGAIPGAGGKRATSASAAAPSQRKSLLLDRPVDQLPVVDDFRWNKVGSQNGALGALMWWLALLLVGVAAGPLAFVVLGRLRDRGWALSRALGLLVVGYFNWMGASLHLTQNRAWVIALFLLLLAGASAFLAWRNREALLAHLRANWRLLVTIEVLFAVAYAAFVVIRVFNPDIWQPWTGGEKFMEFAFLNATLKSAYFPPYDPYFAGGTLNYYYYGQYLVSLLTKLTGITPAVAFNLAIPSLFAMTVVGAFGVGYSLAGRRKADGSAPAWTRGLAGGLLAAAFVTLMGNLATVTQIVRSLGNVGGSQFQSHIPNLQPLVRMLPGILKVAGGRPMPPFDYWDVSRVIPNTINEFPFWSFLFADLHPHMIALPFVLLTLGLALNLRLWPAVAGGRQRYAVAILAAYIPTLEEALAWLALPLAVGALAVINTWDLPTYLGVMLLAYALRVGGPGERRLGLIKTALFAGFLGAGSILLYAPFFRAYAAMHVGIGVVREKTDVWLWLTIWGAFVFMALSYVIIELGRVGERPPLLRLARLAVTRWQEAPIWGPLQRQLVRDEGYAAGRGALLFALAALVLFAALGYWVIGLSLLILLGAALLFLRQRATPEASFVNALFFAGFLLLCGVEVFFLRDFLQGGDHYRMNTLFKFYMQVWVLLGLACGVVLPGLCDAVARKPAPAGRGAWQVALTALLAGTFLFLPLGIPARVSDRFPGARPALGTLSGMDYMVGSYTWPDPSYRIELRYDREAILWLQEHVKGTPVLAEAAVAYYREGGLRVSTFTGLPTLVGMHQNEQRWGDMVGRREDQARQFFDSPDINVAQRLINELNISLIYIGQLERAPKLYSPAGIAKFERMAEAGQLREVYRNERVVIYAVEDRWDGIPGSDQQEG